VDRPGTEFRTRIFLNILKDKNYAEERILDLGRKFARIREDSLALYEDVEDLFENLTGKFKLGLLTNGPSNLQRRKIDVLGIDRWFDEIIVSGEHDLAKPDPRIFYIALEELNSDPEQTIYVGNSLEYDVLGANNAGVPVIWKKNGEDNPGMEEAKPTFVINELRELIHQDRISSSSEGEKRSIKS
jgi:HAD superfamily hydrolase (TIGR01549 family)